MGVILPSRRPGGNPIQPTDGQNGTVIITEADRERIRRRYPSKRLSPAVMTVLGFLVLAMIGYVIWVASERANPAVAARVDTFAVVSDNEMRATLAVDRPDPSKAARCFVIVQAVSYDRVGERWIDVPPGNRQLTAVEVSVRTFKRGTAITVESCLLA